MRKEGKLSMRIGHRVRKKKYLMFGRLNGSKKQPREVKLYEMKNVTNKQ